MHHRRTIVADDSGPYDGPTYYGLPALKAPHYRWTVVAYFFIGGLASAAQFLAAVIDLFGGEGDRPVVRLGRYLALAGALASPPLLIIDLLTPRRWYNMMRIFRPTSTMSIGSWALTTFGLLTGVTAAGQLVEDLFGWRLGRWVARLAGLPAATAGAVVSLYTGTLFSATNVPLWLASFPLLSSLFASSAASTASAALTLAGEATGASESTRRLGRFALISGGVELALALVIERRWRRKGVSGPARHLAAAWRVGVLGTGLAVPLAIHATEALTGRHSRKASILASLAALVGGFLLRAVFVLGGAPSSQRPEDYFALTRAREG